MSDAQKRAYPQATPVTPSPERSLDRIERSALFSSSRLRFAFPKELLLKDKQHAYRFVSYDVLEGKCDYDDALDAGWAPVSIDADPLLKEKYANKFSDHKRQEKSPTVRVGGQMLVKRDKALDQAEQAHYRRLSAQHLDSLNENFQEPILDPYLS